MTCGLRLNVFLMLIKHKFANVRSALGCVSLWQKITSQPLWFCLAGGQFFTQEVLSFGEQMMKE